MSKKVLYYCILLFMFSLISGCGSGNEGGNYAWIDVPLTDSRVPLGQTISIKGHATSLSEVAWVEIWVDGETQAQVEELSFQGNLASFAYEWVPPGEGQYLIQIFSIDTQGGISQSDQARVFVGEATREAQMAEITDTPIPTATPSPEEAPQNTNVLFWADPAEIQAGACTTMFWDAEGVQRVVFGGVERPLVGSYEDCLCATERYSLFVTHLDGSEERIQVTIAVTGLCETPTPTETEGGEDSSGGDSGSGDGGGGGGSSDTNPPTAPKHDAPDNGASLSCKASQSMSWFAPNDESGIDHYEIEVQRHSGDNNWKAVIGSPFSTGTAEQSVSVECGWTYRWRVRAEDGSGNVGDWSNWTSYVIPLT